jgi:hypothetical protein
MLRAGWSEVRIPGGWRKFSSSSKRLDWLYGPLSFLFSGYRSNFWVTKRPGLELKHSHLAPVLIMKWVTLLLSLHGVRKENITLVRITMNVKINVKFTNSVDHFRIKWMWRERLDHTLTLWTLYSFFWVIPRRLNFMYRRLGTLRLCRL